MADDQDASAIRIDGTLYDLTPLRDPPIVLWELLEKKGMLGQNGQLRVAGIAQAFDFLHIALVATFGVDGLATMLAGDPPPVDRKTVSKIPTSQIQVVMERVAGVLGVDQRDVSKLRPTNARSSTPRTRSDARTGGASPKLDG